MRTNEKSYFEVAAVSQSFLKKLASSPYFAKQMLDNEKENRKGRRKAFDFGSALDMMVTQPDLDVRKEFYIVKTPRPSGKLHDLLVYIESNDLPYTKESIDIAIDKVGYGGKNWKKETIESGVKPLKDYISELEEAEDYEYILTEEQLEDVEFAFNQLKNDVFASKWLFGDNARYQVVVISDLFDVKCKGMFDVLVIDKELKVFWIVDLKSMEGNPLNFSNSFFKFRYDIQASFYAALAATLVELNEYTFGGFNFVVVSSNRKGTPIVYKTPEKVLQFGYLGGTYKGAVYRGWKSLLEEYITREYEDEWEFPLNYKKDGYSIIDDSNINI